MCPMKRASEVVLAKKIEGVKVDSVEESDKAFEKVFDPKSS